MNYKKIILCAAIFVIAASVGFTPKVKAITASEIQAQIAQLLAQVAQLQQQLAGIQGTSAVWCHDFTVNLKYGDSGSEVQALEQALVKEGFSVTEHSSNFPALFDEKMASFFTGFQEKYKDEILTPWGLAYGTGFVGKTTREKLNRDRKSVV